WISGNPVAHFPEVFPGRNGALFWAYSCNEDSENPEVQFHFSCPFPAKAIRLLYASDHVRGVDFLKLKISANQMTLFSRGTLWKPPRFFCSKGFLLPKVLLKWNHPLFQNNNFPEFCSRKYLPNPNC